MASLFYNIFWGLKKLLQLCKRRDEEDQQQLPEQEIVNWDQLCDNLLQGIISKLNLRDRLRMSMVCKSWRSAVLFDRQYCSSGNRFPWLMLPYVSDIHSSMKFFDFSEGTLYNIETAKRLRGARCLGSSKGWFLCLQGSQVDPDIFLFNPISGGQVPLPSLTTNPFFQSYLFVDDDPYDFFVKLELSSADASNCIVAAMCFFHNVLSLCTPQDKSWTVFEGEDDYQDILFHNGILYASIDHKDYTPLTLCETYTLKVGDEDDVILKQIPSGIPEVFPVEWTREVYGNQVIMIGRLNQFVPYLVQFRGELLVVHKIIDVTLTRILNPDDPDDPDDDDHGGYAEDYNDNINDNHDDGDGYDEDYYDSDGDGDDSGESYTDSDDDYDDSDDDRVYHYEHSQTRGFEVFKVGHTNDETCISRTRLNSLGHDGMLFVAKNGSLSVVGRERDFNGLKKNCIFFLDESCSFNESGIFYFEDGKIERSFPTMRLFKMSWFSPNINV